jgi:nicotinamide mononucleotide transporter
LAVSRLSPGRGAIWVIVIVVGSVFLGRFMKRRTRAALPYVDAATTVMSVVAQYLLGCKVLENWVLWIVADVVDTGVYLRRKLYLTSLLYLVLLVLAVMGFVEWARK